MSMNTTLKDYQDMACAALLTNCRDNEDLLKAARFIVETFGDEVRCPHCGAWGSFRFNEQGCQCSECDTTIHSDTTLRQGVSLIWDPEKWTQQYFMKVSSFCPSCKIRSIVYLRDGDDLSRMNCGSAGCNDMLKFGRVSRE